MSDPEIEILEDLGTQQLPHLRPDCTIHPFKEGNKRNYCPKCYCYVCDFPVSECQKWVEHCLANPKDSHWKALRVVYREKKTTDTTKASNESSSNSIRNVNGIKIEKSSGSVSSGNKDDSNLSNRGNNSSSSSSSSSAPNVYVDLTGDSPILVNRATQQRSLLVSPAITRPASTRPVYSASPQNLNNTNRTNLASPQPPVSSMPNSSTSFAQSSATKSKSKAKSKVALPSAKPKRPLSVYNIFMRDDLKNVKAANPTLSHKEAFKISVANWHAHKERRQQAGTSAGNGS